MKKINLTLLVGVLIAILLLGILGLLIKNYLEEKELKDIERDKAAVAQLLMHYNQQSIFKVAVCETLRKTCLYTEDDVVCRAFSDHHCDLVIEGHNRNVTTYNEYVAKYNKEPIDENKDSSIIAATGKVFALKRDELYCKHLDNTIMNMLNGSETGIDFRPIILKELLSGCSADIIYHEGVDGYIKKYKEYIRISSINKKKTDYPYDENFDNLLK